MGKYIEHPIAAYLGDAASNKPAPGGGSVSALTAALGCSMGEMAANFTVGKKKFDNVREDIQESLHKLNSARKKLENLVDDDVHAYNAVIEAQSLPKNTEKEKELRKEQLHEALKNAMFVPLNIMRQCLIISRESETLAAKANPYLITDVGVCATLAEAACAAARFNVEVNLKYMNEQQIEHDVREEMTRLCKATRAGRERVEKKVRDALQS